MITPEIIEIITKELIRSEIVITMTHKFILVVTALRLTIKFFSFSTFEALFAKVGGFSLKNIKTRRAATVLMIA